MNQNAKTCYNCGATLAEDAVFCEQCGTKVPLPEEDGSAPAEPVSPPSGPLCLNCGATLPEDAVFCERYGTKVGSSEKGSAYIPPSPPPEPVKKKKKTGLIIGIVAGVVALLGIAAAIVLYMLPRYHYQQAEALEAEGEYLQAADMFQSLGDFSDSGERAQTLYDYLDAIDLYDSGRYEKAIAAFEALDGFEDSEDMLEKAQKEYEAYRDEQYEKAGEYWDTWQPVHAAAI